MTIGSCFARNIERALKQLDLNVMSSYVPEMTGDDNISNKYTSRSILSDLELAFGVREQTDDELRRTIYVNDKGQARNLAFGGAGTGKTNTPEHVLAVSHKYYKNLEKVREADIVVVTFGLVETWYDTQNDIYLNIPPARGEIRKQSNRFELHVFSYEDVRADMAAIFDLISSKGKKGVQILTTISPVPLHNTFRDQDCLQANTYSKAVQRAAIEEVIRDFDNVHYFPSYEMVTLAAPKIAWVDDDFRHVRPKTVDRIMRKIIKGYIGDAALPPEKSELRGLFGKKSYDVIITMVDAYLEAVNTPIDQSALFMKYYYGASCLALGRIDEGLRLIHLVLEQSPDHPNANKFLKQYAEA
nr:GSCFA domain-containing protein [Aliiroseovarius sp. S2029]